MGDPQVRAPSIALPKGGGAIKGIGEKFAANPVTGSGSLSIPVPLSPGRSGFTPALTLTYDSGAGNGPYGFGWRLDYPQISRRTDRGLPRYLDREESDVFVLSGAEDLVPVLAADGARVVTVRGGYRVARYRPRVEGLFARIERWTNVADPADTFWRSIARDNTTSVYGRTAASRIADPADATRIFAWLLSESYDDKGDAAMYEYVAEDSRSIDARLSSESNRTDASRAATRYLKRVRYGNRTSRLIQPDLAVMTWLFEVVLDYGDHRDERPSPVADLAWPVRPDPFSLRRAGFELRTYRRCRRFLVFHAFEELGADPALVRSLTLDYDDFGGGPDATTRDELAHQGSTHLGSLLRRATLTGYADDGFAKSMPPIELTYSRPTISTEVRTLDEASAANLPAGIDGSRQRWLDLDSNGLSGVLTGERGAWWFKPNLGDGRIGPAQLVATLPSAGAESRVEFLDLAGDGLLDAVQLDAPRAGFFEREDERTWAPFTPFASQPNVDWSDRNLRLVDLTGDGRADVLITESDAMSWHPSLAEDGFGPRESVRAALDEAAGPTLVLDDTTDTIVLADMAGDGLSDLVRIRNGEVCYWPNLGYGRFGAKIAMDDAPVFDTPDAFDARRIRLADIDGSGTTDIIYLARDGVRVYFNRSGNGWTDADTLDSFPPIDNVSTVSVTDLLGNGTACLVWSTPLPRHARAPIAYVDLMGGQKPHLLVGIENNLGARTRIEYVASTKFFLEDALAGRPWITHLPFPVHVVERTEQYDEISRSRFITRFAYHHGYFDGVEREFRGFGRVERWDTEELSALTADHDLPPTANIDAASHLPPILTRSWFHTGNYVDGDRVSNMFAGLQDADDQGEYYREPGVSDDEARRLLLDDTVLPEGLTAEEEREACRALKGALLRQEVYALDGTAKEPHPYLVTEQNFTIRVLQRQGINQHAVFLTHPRESLGYHYERVPADPRIVHGLTIEADDFGNVLRSATIAYGRRNADPTLEPRDQAKQAATHIVVLESRVTNAVDSDDAYRVPLPCASQSFELTGLALGDGAVRFSLDDVRGAGLSAAAIAFHEAPTPGTLQKRLIDEGRRLYRADDLLSALPLGRLESLAIGFESYKLAFTPGLLTSVYGSKVDSSMLPADGRYVDVDGDGRWWIPSGRLFFSIDAGDDAAAERAAADAHFFLPRRYVDAFGQTSTVDYDPYDLLIRETRDPLLNVTTVGERDGSGNPIGQGHDYRVLQARMVTDPNGNRSAVVYDALGLVAGTAVMGKRDQQPQPGDRLDDLVADLPDDVVLDYLSQPLNDPHGLLQRATTRFVYDLFAYARTKDQPQPSPLVASALIRETHDADLAPGVRTKIQQGFVYSDGFGREIQKKTPAEPETPGGAPRWSTSGWTVFDNKGNAVRTFEPFFSATHRFEPDVRVGVSPILFYDPVGRVVATLNPNHTWEKVVFGPWREERWDLNDTILVDDPRADPDVGSFFARLPSDDFLPGWHAQRIGGALGADEQAAAVRTAVHANTPSLSHADSLGRAILTIAHNRFAPSDAPPTDPPIEERYATRVELDIQGHERALVDARNRVVARYDYDLVGRRLHQASMDTGERWLLGNVASAPVYAWDSRDQRVRTDYDDAQRPVSTFLRDGSGPERLVARTVYGESQPAPEVRNLRGRVVQHFDQSGVVTTDDYDFKGNQLTSRRQLAREYRTIVDWSSSVDLEDDVFISRARFDALNRSIEQTAPDGSVVHLTFNEANLLERIDANLRGEAATTTFVSNVDYDAKGRRTLLERGNGARTSYEYDPLTFRLARLLTRRSAAQFPADCPQPADADWPGCHVQDLRYTYDPMGSVTRIRDGAQARIYFRNRRVDPSNDYIYDATYRLIEARGREHLGQNSGQPPSAPDAFDEFRTHLEHPADGNAMATYVERYMYDGVGNVLAIDHRNGTSPADRWTRTYTYAEASQLEPAADGNRLSATSIAGVTESYAYDGPPGIHGAMTAMPHLPLMRWNHDDQLQAVSTQAIAAGSPETTWYVYHGAGLRTRKVTERQTADGTPAPASERLYVGGFEIYRELAADATVTLQRETLLVAAGADRIALVETRTTGNDGSPARLIRYQIGNHIASSSLELDEAANVITYEEYYPFGSTSFQSVRAGVVELKRYRYTGMERDVESGLSYHGARYYAPWLARWTSGDPSGTRAGTNLYRYVSNNPIVRTDVSGRDEVTIHHRTTAKAAAKMTAGGAKTNVSRAHVWAGSGFYGLDTPNIPGTSGARGDVIVSQKINVDHMVDLTDRKLGGERITDLFQDSARGRQLRSLVYSQMHDASSSRISGEPGAERVESWFRDYVGQQLNKIAPNADVIRWKNPDGTFTYVVRKASALVGKPEIAGDIVEGRFVARTAPVEAAPAVEGEGRARPVAGEGGGVAGAVLTTIGVLGTIPAVRSMVSDFMHGHAGRALETAGWTAAGFYGPTMPLAIAKGVIGNYRAHKAGITKRANAVGEFFDPGSAYGEHTVVGGVAAAGYAVGESTVRTGVDIVVGAYHGAKWIVTGLWGLIKGSPSPPGDPDDGIYGGQTVGGLCMRYNVEVSPCH